jgi:hypothetical protein
MRASKTNSRVRHTVFFQFRDDASPAEIEHFFREMFNLKTQGKVKGILSFSYGQHESSEGLNQGFNHGMTLVFENPEARDAYLPHPEHERVKSLVIPLLKDGLNSVIAVDWYLQENDEF